MENRLFRGEYIRTVMPDGREEFKSVWTGKRWILEEDEFWMGGPYFKRGNHAFSFKEPELKIELSAKAAKNWMQLWMLVERPVYRDSIVVRDARTDGALFVAECLYACDAGLVVEYGGTLRFTDGVRKTLQLGKIGRDENVMTLRVSETEYSLRVGHWSTGYRYILLDAARWTATRV